MRTCLGCGAGITKRHQLAYCSNACQRARERAVKIATWLATGDVNVIGSSRHFVRLHLLEAQQGRCAICRQAAEWNGLPLTLVLDHVDGDATNNRRANLRLVCPNCDSQLPTYKSRNRGRGRHARRQRYANGQSY